MRSFIVRLNGDQTRPGELVGIFFVEDEDELYRMIEESIEPEACEYKEVHAGGIYWSEPVDFIVPYKAEHIQKENPPSLPGGADLTESWIDTFAFNRDVDWVPFEPDDLGATLD